MRRGDASRYVDDLIRGRRPRPVEMEEGDAETIRTATTLSAARPGGAEPREEWMSQLRSELADIHGRGAGVAGSPSGRLPRRTQNVLWAVAAAAALIVATAGLTSTVEHRSPGGGARVRTVALHDGLDRRMGDLSLYSGRPSWVFLDVVDPGYSGPATCQLETGSGTVVLAGTFMVQQGQGDWARPIPVDPSVVRAARIVAPGGRTLASATFPAGAGTG